MRIYVAGVCGTFMGGLARVAVELGHEVGGCDSAVYPPMSTQLEDLGIQVDEGFEPAALDRGWELFVVGNVLSRGNPLVEEIMRRRAAFVSGPEWLAREALAGRRVSAVAGTHGKTTTTAMLAWILDRAGLAPGFLVGGVPLNFDASARAGSGSPHFVVEADEYDVAFFDKRPKFLHYRPEVLVLNNLEFDHADVYDDLDAIERQFHFLLRTVPGDGAVVYRAGDVALRRVLDKGVWTRCESFGIGAALGGPGDADWYAEAFDGGFRAFYRGREQGECRWSLFGEYNVANALAAVAAAHHAGVETAISLRALADFRGVRRRLEVKGEASGVVVYDDFAHHPSAIRATLEAVAGRVGNRGGRVIAVFEPRSNTMKTGRHNEELTRAFIAADKVFCRRPAALAAAVDPAISRIQPAAALFDDGNDLLARLCDEVQAGDRVVFMSNGGFDDLPARLTCALGGIPS